MNLLRIVPGKFPSQTAARWSVAAGMFVASLVLFAGPAGACCTAVVCPYCVSSSSQCVCGPQHPVCNVFACNCNVQCGMWTPDFNTGLCYFSPTCDGAAAARAQERFKEIDANNDGKISHDEAWAWVVKKRGESWLTGFAKGELPAQTKATDEKATFRFAFDKVDTDHDGSISPGEMDASLAPKKKK